MYICLTLFSTFSSTTEQSPTLYTAFTLYPWRIARAPIKAVISSCQHTLNVRLQVFSVLSLNGDRLRLWDNSRSRPNSLFSDSISCLAASKSSWSGNSPDHAGFCPQLTQQISLTSSSKAESTFTSEMIFFAVWMCWVTMCSFQVWNEWMCEKVTGIEPADHVHCVSLPLSVPSGIKHIAVDLWS